MKFLIITIFGSTVIEAEDFTEAANIAYDNHTGHKNVQAIVKLPDDYCVKGD